MVATKLMRMGRQGVILQKKGSTWSATQEAPLRVVIAA
jgi:hypothetical protein